MERERGKVQRPTAAGLGTVGTDAAESRGEEEQGLEVGHVWSGHMECLRNSEEASAAGVGKWGELKEVKLCKATFLF